MFRVAVPFMLLCVMTSTGKYFQQQVQPLNMTYSTPQGIAAYRSALTLDWLAAEDNRQRELVNTFESQPLLANKMIDTDCVSYPRPSASTVARLMLEMLKNLEGDVENKSIVYDLIQALVKRKLLKLETTIYDSEPDLEALMKTPIELAGEPHVTLPRIMAISWMAVTDPSTVKKHGWCTINRISKYVNIEQAPKIAQHIRVVDPILSRARFIMEEFIQHVTPLNMLKSTVTPGPPPVTTKQFTTMTPFERKVQPMTLTLPVKVTDKLFETTRKFTAIIGTPLSDRPLPAAKPKSTNRSPRLVGDQFIGQPEINKLVMSNSTVANIIDVARLKTSVNTDFMDYEVMYGNANVVRHTALLFALTVLLLSYH